MLATKIKVLLAFILFIPELVVAQSSKYKIIGKIGNISSPAKVTVDFQMEPQRPKFSVVLHKGNFIITGTLKEPTYVRLILWPDGKQPRGREDATFIFLVPGTTRVMTKDSLRRARLSGTQQNVSLQFFGDMAKNFQQKIAVLQSDTSDLNKRQLYHDVKIEYYTAVLHFAQDHPDALISIGAVQIYSEVDPKAAIAIFKELSPEVRNLSMSKKIAHALEKMIILTNGTLAPDFSLPDTDNHPSMLSNYRGKYVLLNFWASWCPPCRLENRQLAILYDRYQVKGFTILGVALERAGERNKWLAAVSKDHLVWGNVAEMHYLFGPVASLYGIELIPHNILIDPQGKIIGKALFGQALEDRLKRIFEPNAITK